jgi:hypothetical protein
LHDAMLLLLEVLALRLTSILSISSSLSTGAAAGAVPTGGVVPLLLASLLGFCSGWTCAHDLFGKTGCVWCVRVCVGGGGRGAARLHSATG